MQPLEQHEKFEIEVLHFLKRKKLLEKLVFGGGTMLRLCHDLNRYSMDIDLYFKKMMDHDYFYEKIIQEIKALYEITDNKNKFNTILVELRHKNYPRRLKIEINKKTIYSIYTQSIAFSQYSTYQVAVDTIPLDQMISNKIKALKNRNEIRDAFDIEFLIRRGVNVSLDGDEAEKILKILKKFSKKDFNVKLGSLLSPEIRTYYRQNRFHYLENIMRNIATGQV